MKKFIALLFCVAAMAFAANANDTNNDTDVIMHCIDVVLGIEQPAPTFNGINLDVNNDGRIDVSDVTALIARNLSQKRTLIPAKRIENAKTSGQIVKRTQRASQTAEQKETDKQP